MDKTLIVEIKDETSAIIGYEYSDPNGKFSAGAETKADLTAKVKELEDATKEVK